MADNLLSSFLPDDRAAFGVFPQMKPRRRLQDVQGSANVPLDVTRGRVAGLAGLLPDVLNFMGRSPMPTEQFGETQYEPAPQLPYGSEYFLQNLPLKPTSRIGEVAGQAGAFVPLNPMPAARAVAAGARALGPTAVRMGEGYLQRQGLMPNVVPEAPVTPATPLSSMVEKPQAPVSPIGFYSAAEQAALALPRKSGTGDAFLNDLMKGQDVKKDELSWMGLDDYLKGKPNVTRQEVQDYIAGNRVDVQEVRLGGNEAPSQDLLNWMSARRILPPRNPEGWQELSQRLESFAQRHQAAGGDAQRTFTLSEEAGRISEGLDAGGSSAGATKYERYQLPGGENYREILLTLPKEQPKIVPLEGDRGGGRWGVQMPDGTITSRYYDWDDAAQALRFDAQKSGVTYTSSHFNQPNILAHMRVNDRIDADGKKMLLIEEVQSDWHQAGREKGYIGNYAKGDVKPYTPERAKAEFGLPNTDLFWYFEVPGNTLQIPKSRFGTQDEAMKYVMTEKKVNPEGVPDAPFKGTWHQLALKRALKYAADNGYDRVGLTTGRQQVDRYSNELRQNVDRLVFGPVTPNQSNIVAYKNGKQTFTGMVEDGKFIDGPAQGKTVEEVLGKTMAKQIAESKAKNMTAIEGNDLTIGGEGMKAYYDQIYPAFFEKQGKKYNAKTGETKINSGKVQSKDELAEQVYGQGMTYRNLPSEQKRKIDEMGFGKGAQSIRYIDISPEMRGGVKKGQPLFTAAPIGGIGLGAGTQDQQQNSINSFIQ